MKKDFFETYKNVYKPSEQVEGTSFTELAAQRGGRIPPEELFDLIKPLFDVLTAAHEAGLIHGDICPDNLVLADGKVSLLNFGRVREDMEKWEGFPVILRNGFSPLEQYIMNKPEGSWTDVYALSATIYYCLTGEKPPHVADRLEDDDLVLPRALGVDIMLSQQKAIQKGMELQPGKRYQSMEELYIALYVKIYPEPPLCVYAGPPPEEYEKTLEKPSSGKRKKRVGRKGIRAWYNERK